jgi:hypothetical protein
MKTKTSTTTAAGNKATVKKDPGTKSTTQNSEKDSPNKAIKKSPSKL